MTDVDYMRRWADLMDARGIAGAGAREAAEEKEIVERCFIVEFAEALREHPGIEVSDISAQQPPLPDFSMSVSGQQLHVELTEFIDPELIKTAKHIRKTPDHPLNDFKVSGGLWFDTSEAWFLSLLRNTILNKEKRYEKNETKIDVLLICNEALQVTWEDGDQWLRQFELPKPKNISSIYFMNWYHPGFVGRPIWAIEPHPLICEVLPTATD